MTSSCRAGGGAKTGENNILAGALAGSMGDTEEGGRGHGIDAGSNTVFVRNLAYDTTDEVRRGLQTRGATGRAADAYSAQQLVQRFENVGPVQKGFIVKVRPAASLPPRRARRRVSPLALGPPPLGSAGQGRQVARVWLCKIVSGAERPPRTRSRSDRERRPLARPPAPWRRTRGQQWRSCAARSSMVVPWWWTSR